MSTSKRILRNSLYLYIRIGLTLIISLWTTRIILNALGIDNFGIYNVVGGLLAMLGFLNGSLSSATQRYINFVGGKDDIEAQKIVFNNSIILHFCLGVILLFIFGIIYIFFKEIIKVPSERLDAARIVYICMIISTVITVISVPYESTIIAHENFKIYAFIGIIEILLKLIIALFITSLKFDRLIIYSLLMMLIPIINLTIQRIYCHKNFIECVFSPFKYFRMSSLKELGSFAGWNFFNSASGITTQYGMNLAVNHFFGVALNAAQGIASQVSGVLMTISTNALKSLNPIIVKSESQHNRSRMLYVSELGCRLTYYIYTFFSIPFICLMPLILKLWLTEVPNWAVIFCQLQMVRLALEMLTLSLNTAIMANGNIKMYYIIKSIINFVPLVAIIVLFNFGFAPYWMYIIWIVSWSIIGGIVNIYFCHKLVNLKYDQFLRNVLSPAFQSTILPIIFLVITYYFFPYNSPVFYSSVTFSTLLFLVLGYRLLITNKEKEDVRRIIFAKIPICKRRNESL